mmetsp:Transcript_6853/g.12446  ORF Transcript_6853/g.12446 Transcript_6853/m.12446 type:complete len:625 (+) Transcript_6853:814-2688(+)
MKFLQWFSSNKLDVWRNHYLRYKALKSQLRVIADHQGGHEQSALFREFHTLLLSELGKVEDFYCSLFQMQQDKWEMAHHRLNEAVRMPNTSRKERVLDELKDTAEGIYLCLSNLYDYSLTNYKAFRHLMFSIEKKADPILAAEMRAEFEEELGSMSFVGKYTGHKLVNSVTKLKEEIVFQVAIHYFEGNVQSARTCLESLKAENTISKLSIFTLGLFLGLGIMICVVIAFVCIEANLDVDTDEHFSAVFPMFRCLMIFAFYSLLQSIEVYIWNFYSIDYQHLLKFQLRVPPVSSHLARGVMFSAAFLVCFAWYISSRLNLVQSEYVVLPDIYTPLVGWTVIFIWLFAFPYKWISYSGRSFIAKILMRSFASPFTKSDFTHVFITDQLISLVIPLTDLEYTLCFYFSSDKDSCQDRMRLAPMLVTFFPLVVRLLQCTRYLYDSRSLRHPQALNAGKYLSSIIVIGFNYAYKTLGGWLVFVWVVTAFISTCYSYAWDLVRDWGLLTPGAKHKFLRQKLVYKSPKMYYWAMISNLLLRFTWVLTISSNIVFESIRPELFTMMLGMAEVFRRTQWNVFRMEFEQTQAQDRLGIAELRTGINTMSRPLLRESFGQAERKKLRMKRVYSV